MLPRPIMNTLGTNEKQKNCSVRKTVSKRNQQIIRKSQMEIFFPLQHLPQVPLPCSAGLLSPWYPPTPPQSHVRLQASTGNAHVPGRSGRGVLLCTQTRYPPPASVKWVLLLEQAGTVLTTCHPQNWRSPKLAIICPWRYPCLQNTSYSSSLTHKSNQNS